MRRALLLAALLLAGCAGEDDGGPAAASLEPALGSEPPAAPLRTFSVSSLSELVSRAAQALPGDEIVLRNGAYVSAGKLSIERDGTAAHPIVIRAESVGGAEISGASGFFIADSSHLVIQGFRFTHRSTGGGSSFATGMEVRSSSHVRVTRNYFRLTDSGYAHWLVITGAGSADNRVDRNRFDTKTSEGLFVGVYGPSGGMSQRDRIDRNHFYRHYWTSEGGESIRIGDSGRQMVSAFTLVEHNLFEDCRGDIEVISNKSCDNVYRHNTFRGNNGSLTLRHGHRATVDGNFFLAGANGIRLYGDDHRVVNNYFEATTGTGGRATIAIGSGDAEDGYNGHGGYDQPERVVVAFNTLVHNASHIDVGTSSAAYAPRDCIVANNVIQGSSGSAARFILTPVNFTWQNNLLWGSLGAGGMPSSGYARADPLLARASDGLLRPGGGSPAIDAAYGAAALSFVAADMDGQARAGALDIGADEVSGAATLGRPLTAADVGPQAP